MSGIYQRFGSFEALSDISMSFDEPITAICGANGAGKSTFIDILSGLSRPSEGIVRLDGSDITALSCRARLQMGLARTFQYPMLAPTLTVAENVAVSAGVRRRRVSALLAELRIDQWERTSVRELPYGIRKVVDLGRALTTSPDILLLDEPLSGLDACARDEMLEILSELNSQGVTLVVVEHDIPRVSRLASHVVVLDFGRKLAEGNPQTVLGSREVQEAFLGMETYLSGPVRAMPAGQAANSRNPIRLSSVTAGYSGAVALSDVSVEMATGSTVSVLGRNGAGKSSLLRVLAGVLRPTKGELQLFGERPPRTVAATARKGIRLVPESKNLFADMTVAENLRSGVVRLSAYEVRQRLQWARSRFPILERLMDRQASTLSGGERQTVAVVRALLARPAVLLLDEPSLGLAPKLLAELLDTVTSAAREGGVTVVLAEQNASAALAVTDSAYWLEAGRVVTTGTAMRTQSQ